jgi:hypothetical protein
MKADKRVVRRSRVDSTSNQAKYSGCRKIGHESARSPECENRIDSKQEVLILILGSGHQTFTKKKASLDNASTKNTRDV